MSQPRTEGTHRSPLAFIGGFLCGMAALGLVWANSIYLQKSGGDHRYPAQAVTGLPLPFKATFKLTREDIAFGEEQVRKMVRDRQLMAVHVKPGDPVWQFCVNGFAGEAVGERISWDPGEPEGGFEGDHMGPFEGSKAAIRIKSSLSSQSHSADPFRCEYLWGIAVYELENIRGNDAFNQLYYRALAGKLTKDVWIRENTRLEHAALLRAARHYWNLWLPLANRKRIATSPYSWQADVPESYDEWIAGYTDPKSYPWDAWGKYYDEDITPYLKARGIWAH